MYNLVPSKYAVIGSGPDTVPRDVFRHALAARDRARSWNLYLAAACVGLFIALLYVASHPTRLTKTAPVCPQSGVMQLDPTAILARKSQSVEI